VHKKVTGFGIGKEIQLGTGSKDEKDGGKLALGCCLDLVDCEGGLAINRPDAERKRV